MLKVINKLQGQRAAENLCVFRVFRLKNVSNTYTCQVEFCGKIFDHNLYYFELFIKNHEREVIKSYQFVEGTFF